MSSENRSSRLLVIKNSVDLRSSQNDHWSYSAEYLPEDIGVNSVSAESHRVYCPEYFIEAAGIRLHKHVDEISCLIQRTKIQDDSTINYNIPGRPE